MSQTRAQDKTSLGGVDGWMIQAQCDPSCKDLYLLMMKRGAYDATRAEIQRLFRVWGMRFGDFEHKWYTHSTLDQAPPPPSLALRGCELTSPLIPKATEGHARNLCEINTG